MTSGELDKMMRALAEVQHAVVARWQLRARGVARQAVAYRLRSPDWEAMTTRVIRLVGAAITNEQRAMAAVLDAGDGAVVSHASAAALWGLPGFNLNRIHLSRPRTGSARPTSLAQVHQSRVLPDHHRTTRAGIPTTTLARTVVDLSATEHQARVELALHAAVRLGMRWAAVQEVVAELEARGRTGVALARSLALGQMGQHPLGSGLEGKLLRILTEAGLPVPRRQVELGAEDWIGRVDFLYEDVRLVIEVDGSWHHEGALDVRRDKRRAAALTAAGFRLLPLSEDLIRNAPDAVVKLVRDARRRGAA